jgi:acetyl-CoA carboxylase carboxyl transferase subunit alpha
MEQYKRALDFEKPLHNLELELQSLIEKSQQSDIDLGDEINSIEKKIESTKEKIYSTLNPWQKVQLSRHPNRPYSMDYLERVFSDFQELHGDRVYGDDAAIVGGVAHFEGSPVMVIGQQKGRDTDQNLHRNFGCPHPEGYRKTLRLMKMAEKFSMPIITLVDTPGAYPGIGAEERHVAEAIAVNLREMSVLLTPIVTIVIGEGGSGGALGMAVADRVLIFENAYYSVISPEGCAAILWKDRSHAPDAARALRIGAADLMELGVVDEIVPEPVGGAHRDPEASAEALRTALRANLTSLSRPSLDQLIASRYDKYRAIGVVAE